jgi:hypothetical protein
MIGIRVESENIQTGKKSTVIRPILQWYPKIQKETMPVPGLILSTEKQVRRFINCLKQIS